jgi:general secretion pathway protein G
MPTRPIGPLPVFRASARKTARKTAFTILEILMVIAIIAVLVGITLTVGQGVQERSRVARARAELAVLAAALDSYKAQYGDYPQTGGFENAGPKTADESGGVAVLVANAESKLFNALFGVFGPRMDAAYAPDPSLPGEFLLGRAYVEGARFMFENREFPNKVEPEQANAFIDPWGRRYQFRYRNKDSPTAWTYPSFVLCSAGQNGALEMTVPNEGLPTLPADSDDLIAGR